MAKNHFFVFVLTLSFLLLLISSEAASISFELLPSLFKQHYKTTSDVINCSCSSCEECESRLNNSLCSEVFLTSNLTKYEGVCINNPQGFNNKTFNCQGYSVEGSPGSIWIKLQNKSWNTIKNCVISGFAQAIFVEQVSNSSLINNIFVSNGIGIYMVYSYGNKIENNSINYSNYGIYLMDSSNNDILANSIESSEYYGIHLMGFSQSTQYNFLAENVLKGNRDSGIYLQTGADYNILKNNLALENEDGITIHSSRNNILENNSLVRNNRGIVLFSSQESVLEANLMENNTNNLYIAGADKEDYIHNISTTNLVDNKPVYYYLGNCNNLVAPEDAGMLGLISCNNVSVNNLIIKNNHPGILLADVNNSYLYNNFLENNGEGISLLDSNRNLIENNHLSSNLESIFLRKSSNNYITNNEFSSDRHSSIYLTLFSDNNTIKNNLMNQSNDGISIYISKHNTILDNSISANQFALFLDGSDYTKVRRNKINSLSVGMTFAGSTNSILEQNKIEAASNGLAFIYNANNNSAINNLVNSGVAIYAFQSSNNSFFDGELLCGDSCITTEYPLSSIFLTNVSFDKNKIQGEGKVYVRWYLDVSVKDSSGNLIEGASVTIRDIYNNEKEFETQNNGTIPRQILEEFYQDATGRHYTNCYNLVVSKLGYYSVSRNLQIFDNEEIIAVLQRIPTSSAVSIE